jgi:tetratricopeptide (TPR) repeat protein
VRVSAALIVRDESAFIEDCLASIAGIVDEIVLVDTGSRDDTVERALQFPIKLHTFAWCQDFSAARNFAIAQATGDWILSIDADERLEVPDRQIWRDLLADETKAAWRLRFYTRLDWTPDAGLRLFRNDPRIRFRGVIHEGVHAGVELVCGEDGREVGHCDLALRHFGYENNPRHKLSRNIPLLRARLAQDPEQVYCWWQLGEMLQRSGDEEAAADAWRKAIDVARTMAPGAYPLSNSMPFFSLILQQHSRGLPVDGLVAEALELFPEQLALQWAAAQLALERGDPEAARPVLEKLAAIDPEIFFDPNLSYAKTLFSYASRQSLALCHFRAGRFHEAAHWYSSAAAAAPDPEACRVKAQFALARASAR